MTCGQIRTRSRNSTIGCCNTTRNKINSWRGAQESVSYLQEVPLARLKTYLGLSSITLGIILGAAAKLVLHILTGAKYGFFADEHLCL